ncbi:hypothetical protein RHSIM_Rhsim08G0128600 [Rhododendron simsii]|uniref:Uncharacterized protein n=1 Tax=Rhododendron simsii TaxID=118357 RepID=A0A834LGM4_RHOSS|nr:hypothetical protein RHSIM_Rhsim08G0128600 [Rhododendron simsii]
MAGREVREYTNLTDPKDRKLGKGKDKIDEEDITFQRMVAKTSVIVVDGLALDADMRLVIEVIIVTGRSIRVGSSLGGSLGKCSSGKSWQQTVQLAQNAHGLWILAPSGWLIYTDARGCRRTWRLPSWTRRYKDLPMTSSLDSDDLLYLKEQMEAEEDAERLLRRTEKRAFAAFKISFCLQQDLLKKVVEVKPKRHRVSSLSDSHQTAPNSTARILASQPELETNQDEKQACSPSPVEKKATQMENPVKSLLAAYESSEDEDN